MSYLRLLCVYLRVYSNRDKLTLYDYCGFMRYLMRVTVANFFGISSTLTSSSAKQWSSLPLRIVVILRGDSWKGCIKFMVWIKKYLSLTLRAI